MLVALPGVQTMEHLDQVLEFLNATPEEKDYSVIGGFTADTVTGTCVYCNHCQPCPAGIDIGLANKYYDLALAGDACRQSLHQADREGQRLPAVRPLREPLPLQREANGADGENQRLFRGMSILEMLFH